MYLHKNLAKAFVIVCTLSLICIPNVLAKDEVSAWVGVSSIQLKDVNGMFDDSLKKVKLKDSPSNVPTIGLEYMHGICNNYKIGARLGVMGKEINVTPNRKDFPFIENNNSYCEIVTVPIMLGGSYSKSISKKISLNGKSFLGYAPINFKSKNSFTNTNTKEKIVKELNKTKGCFILDFSIGTEWLLTKRFGVGLDVGYRFTTEISPSKDIKIDLSGATFALGFSYKI